MAVNIPTQLLLPLVIEKPKLTAWNASLKSLRNSFAHGNYLSGELPPEIMQIAKLITDSKGFVFSKDITDVERAEFINLTGEVFMRRNLAVNGSVKTVLFKMANAKNSDAPTAPRLLTRFFGWLELSSRILPFRVRSEVFEPSYNDAKRDFLESRPRFKGKFQRRFLELAFVFNVGLLIVQSLWGMCSTNVKNGLIWLVPEVLRKLFRF